jgi:RNA polymerase sigma factor (TIGR02999 family)
MNASALRARLTADLVALRGGDPAALGRVVTVLYDDLKRLARGQLRGHRAATLDTTGLVHEAFLRLVDQTAIAVEDRAHFLSLCARVMRQVMIDAARARLAQKRGGAARSDLPVEETGVPTAAQAEWLIDLHRAVERIGELDERLERLIECRLFAGLTNEEAALALGLSLRSAEREWARARAWLKQELD